MFSHWFLNSSMLDVRSMACQTNAECILRFRNVLDGTSSALNQVQHVAGSTVRGGFHTKLCASCSAVEQTDGCLLPTDTHQYLHQHSCHPSHCKLNIAYSQALWIRRICSRSTDYQQRVAELKKHLIRQGHDGEWVHEGLRRILECHETNY